MKMVYTSDHIMIRIYQTSFKRANIGLLRGKSSICGWHWCLYLGRWSNLQITMLICSLHALQDVCNKLCTAIQHINCKWIQTCSRWLGNIVGFDVRSRMGQLSLAHVIRGPSDTTHDTLCPTWRGPSEQIQWSNSCTEHANQIVWSRRASSLLW